MILLLAIGLVQTEWGQNWLVHQVTGRLSKDLRSRIHIDHVEIGFFNHLNLNGVLVEDQHRDTLLYAGTVQVRVTDWFFWAQKPVIKYIGLENAVIKLQRSDSVWNYHFLEAYFASGPSTGKKKESGLDFNLKRVWLQKVNLLQRDGWIGSDMNVRVGSLELDANDISFNRRVIDINSLALDHPYFRLYDYTGNRPDSLRKRRRQLAVAKDSLQWNPDNWQIRVGSVRLKEGRFQNEVEVDRPVYTYFDEKHIDFHSINGTLKNLRWDRDTISARVSLSTRERSGLEVKALQADYRFHPKLMEFKNLLLRTNRSELTNYYAMHYGDLDSMQNYIQAVTMVANFQHAFVSSEDIAFFAPALKGWDRNFQLTGKGRGTVDDLHFNGLTLETGTHTYFNGDLSLTGLPDINGTFAMVKAREFRTTYADAVDFIPQLKKVTIPDFRKVTYLNFTGNYTGFFNDFVTYGRIQTNLGTLNTDLNFKFPKGRPEQYSGTVSTQQFQLGTFLNNDQLGAVSFDGKIRGQGFTARDLDLDINGTIHRMEYGGYPYQNITANGRLGNQQFNGDFVIKDPNADLHLTGLINFKSAQPAFNAHADIGFANFKALQLSKENLVLKGIFDLDFTGKNLNDFLGTARITHATLLENDKRLSFDSLSISSFYNNGQRTLRASSNELDATISGNFDLQRLPDAVTLFLNRYYPSYIKPPRHAVQNQAFSFDIKTGIVEDYTRLLDKRLSGFSNSHITGSLDLAKNALIVDANVPQFGYNNYLFSGIQINAAGDLNRLKVDGLVNDIVVSDSLHFPQTTVSLQVQNDISDLAIKTTSNQAINQANLAAQVQTFSDGFKVMLQPSNFVLTGKTWSLEPGGRLEFRNNKILDGQVVLHETSQEIRLSTHASETGSGNDLLVSLKDINLGDISPLVLSEDRVEGLLSGNIHIENPQEVFNVSADLHTEQLRVDNDSIGQVNTSLAYNHQTGLLKGSGGNVDPEHKILFDLALNLQDSLEARHDRITIQPVNYPVKILERFIGGLFSDLQGTVTGKLDILGTGANRDYVGKASLKNAGLKVNFTQVFYKIDDTQIDLKADEINFGTMKLHDRFGNTATVRGRIKHKSFRNMEFDMEAKVTSRQMELLNTGYNDNQEFYGRAMGTGSLVLVGPENDLYMNISATASTTDSSYIILPPSRSRESGSADFMVEKKYGQEMANQALNANAANIKYDISLNANPWVNVEVILDELTGDVIRGRGTGNLRISAGTNEPLSLRGRYNILDGSYLFTFQSFFKKPFELRRGENSYIEWTGDPYGARIQFDAIYTANQVSFAPLASGLDLNSRVKSYRGDVNVVATLTGELFHPNFTFHLEVPDNAIFNQDPSLEFALKQLEKNPNEINKQVTYLIVFNSFAPYESTQISGQLNEFAYSTISGLFFGEINKRLNQLLNKILRNNNLTVNFTGSVYNRNLLDKSSSGFNINQSDLGFSVGYAPAVFNNRLNITFGSTFDVPLQSNIEQNIQFLPDVTAEWMINKSGTIRASFFYRQNLDFLTGTASGTGLRTTRTGATISYHREYDSLKEFLFGRKKSKRQKEPLAPSAADSSGIVSEEDSLKQGGN